MKPDRFEKALALLSPGTTKKDIPHLMALASGVQFSDVKTAEEFEKKQGAFNTQVRTAFMLAADIYRARGIPYTDRYYCDPIRIYEKLKENKRAEPATVLAAILHPVLRPETSTAQEPGYYKSVEPYFEKIKKEFGSEVYGLVCNALQIREINYLARTTGHRFHIGDLPRQSEEERAKGFRTMLAEVVTDRRAAFIRLAMRQVALENAVDKLSLEDRYQEIYRNEQVYEPFAIQQNARAELEAIRDFNLQYQQPEVFEDISREIAQANDIVTRAGDKDNVRSMAGREAVALKLIEEKIKAALPKEWADFCVIERRVKKASSIYLARKKKGAQMDISDIIGFRVIVTSSDEAGAVRDVYFKGLAKKLKTDPNRKMKNFVDAPKDNGFQAIIHTFVFPGKELSGRFEIQVVGKDMHAYNEETHPTYKGADDVGKEPHKDTCTVYISGGEVHSVPVGASSADLLAHLSPEVAFSVNARSISISRADAFKPLVHKNNQITQPLQTGDYVQFQTSADALTRRGNRRAIMRACKIDGSRAKLAAWNAAHPA